MKSFASQVRMAAVVIGTLAFAGGALATTKPQHAQKGFHCVNPQKQELKGARTARECKAPYKWLATAQTPKAKAKAKAVAQVKAKKKIATGPKKRKANSGH